MKNKPYDIYLMHICSLTSSVSNLLTATALYNSTYLLSAAERISAVYTHTQHRQSM